MLTKPSHRHVPHLLKVETPASFLFDPCDHFQETLAVTSAISKGLEETRNIALCREDALNRIWRKIGIGIDWKAIGLIPSLPHRG